MKKFIIALFMVFAATVARAACTVDEIDVSGDGTNCQDTHFSVTTTNDTDAFGFYMSAAGTFYVDWGDGTVQTITRTNDTDYTKYEHEYNSAGAYTVRFGGTATGYNSDYGMPTITFNETEVCYGDCVGDWSKNIASVSGSLSALFPMFGTNDGRHPSFSNTFNGCTGLTSIPADLFSGITTGAKSMFDHTFYGCTGLTSIPADLFSGITTGAKSMFDHTFYGCTGLTSIPAGLFGGITTGANYMFSYTFYGCTGLTSIPADLFSGITTAAEGMFSGTFAGCTGITGYIPKSTFAGLIEANSPTATNMWRNTFQNTQLSSECPGDTTTVETTYKGTPIGTKWGNYAMCEETSCGAGQYLNLGSCITCPSNSYCIGGTSAAVSCSNGTYSPAGMWESAQCGRILHIGDEVVYLRASKITDHALHVDVDHDGVADYFGNMTTADVVMHAGSERKLKVKMNGIIYSIYDDTVTISE